MATQSPLSVTTRNVSGKQCLLPRSATAPPSALFCTAALSNAPAAGCDAALVGASRCDAALFSGSLLPPGATAVVASPFTRLVAAESALARSSVPRGACTHRTPEHKALPGALAPQGAADG